MEVQLVELQVLKLEALQVLPATLTDTVHEHSCNAGSSCTQETQAIGD